MENEIEKLKSEIEKLENRIEYLEKELEEKRDEIIKIEKNYNNLFDSMRDIYNISKEY